MTKTYCSMWPVGCMFCDLELCDGKKETAIKKLVEQGVELNQYKDAEGTFIGELARYNDTRRCNDG